MPKVRCNTVPRRPRAAPRNTRQHGPVVVKIFGWDPFSGCRKGGAPNGSHDDTHEHYLAASSLLRPSAAPLSLQTCQAAQIPARPAAILTSPMGQLPQKLSALLSESLLVLISICARH